MSSQGNALYNISAPNETIWDIIINKITEYYSKEVYDNWFSNLEFVSISSSKLVISAPTAFVRNWIISNYFDSLKSIAQSVDSNINMIEIQLREQNEAEVIDVPTKSNSAFFTTTLDKKFKFDNFVLGSGNELAYKAVESIALQHQESPFKTLFLQGAVGMGKTHLLQAMASKYNETKKNCKVAYVSGERYMHNYWVSVRNNSVIEFREQIRQYDMIAIDDIQFVCSKDSTKNEFYNTLNYYMESNKKIILAGSVPLHDLPVDERNRSRIAGGFTVDISNADFNLRKSVATQKAKELALDIEENVVEYVAHNVTNNIRELEGAIKKIASYKNLLGKDICMQNLPEVIGDNLALRKLEISFEDILKETSQYFKLAKKDILSKRRTSNVVHARQVVAYLAKKSTKLSLQEIGECLGGRDHSTIVYSISKLEDRIASSEQIMVDINNIYGVLRG